jgi:hypothetical protein
LQDDDKLLEQLVTSLLGSKQQAVDNLSTSWEQAVRTHPVDKLLGQHCYKSAAGLLQLVRFTCVEDDTKNLPPNTRLLHIMTRMNIIFPL